ncbi:nuclear transport factor 2 family protein [Actinopolymorpha pittospori]|uniref:Ketosteroid isomerase-like protein n=1 Tax=Actinopolymorpha pittospori TaxID=648752 RepID=A0A927MUI6_9ACTN|nr:ketosteroid isomerase-like protein [Actinopolymorpha pittospori]
MSDVDAATMVREHVRAFNAGDVDALLAGFTEDAVWITGTAVVRGRAGLRTCSPGR